MLYPLRRNINNQKKKMLQILRASVVSASQLFVVESEAFGAIVYLAVLIYSPVTCLFGFLGSLGGSLVGEFKALILCDITAELICELGSFAGWHFTRSHQSRTLRFQWLSDRGEFRRQFPCDQRTNHGSYLRCHCPHGTHATRTRNNLQAGWFISRDLTFLRRIMILIFFFF